MALTDGVEADFDDPAGMGREWFNYMLAAGLTAGAVLAGATLIGRPIAGLMNRAKQNVTQAASDTASGDVWDGV